MVNRTLLAAMALLLGLAARAQDYKPMAYTSGGGTPSKQLYLKKLAPNYVSTDRKYQQQWNDHLYEIQQGYASAARQKQFIREDYVLRYLQSVLLPILDSNRIKRKIEIVCTRYQEPNAYNMGDNRLYVNIGALSVLDNEAQLAFLLCHELSHYLLDHVQQQYVQKLQLASDKKLKQQAKDIRRAKYNKLDRAAEFSRKYDYLFANYSRQKERAADSLAIELLRHSRYRIREGGALLAKLREASEDSTRIDYNRYFREGSRELREEWLRDKRYPISFGNRKAIEYEEDSLRTHPDIPERTEFIGRRSAAHGGDALFAGARTAFDSIRAAARYEIIESYATNKRYAAVLYYSLRLMQDQPDNPYLIRSAAYAFRNLVRAAKNHTIQDYIPVESESLSPGYNDLLRLLDHTTLPELSQLYKNFYERYRNQLSANADLKPTDEKSKS